MPDRLLELAADARSLIDREHNRRVAETWSEPTHAAVTALIEHLAASVGHDLADRAVTRWIITRQPLRECVETERAATA